MVEKGPRYIFIYTRFSRALAKLFPVAAVDTLSFIALKRAVGWVTPTEASTVPKTLSIVSTTASPHSPHFPLFFLRYLLTTFRTDRQNARAIQPAIEYST